MTPQIPHAAQRRPLHLPDGDVDHMPERKRNTNNHVHRESHHRPRAQSAGMSMTYANISDPAVLADYQSVLQPSTRRGSANACAWRGNWPTTPRSAAGTVKSTVTSASLTASEACSANSANPPTGQKTRPEWAIVLPTADPPTA
jgi:hypothetical protein